MSSINVQHIVSNLRMLDVMSRSYCETAEVRQLHTETGVFNEWWPGLGGVKHMDVGLNIMNP